MKYKYIKNGLCILLVIISSVAVCPAFAQEKITDFALVNAHDGKEFKIAEHRGKGGLIVFGSMYCRPCIQLIPVVNMLFEKYEVSEAVIIGVDIDSSTDNAVIQKFASEKQIQFPLLIDTSKLARQLKVFMLPTTLIFDKDGIVVKRFIGFQKYSVLENELEKVKVPKKKP